MKKLNLDTGDSDAFPEELNELGISTLILEDDDFSSDLSSENTGSGPRDSPYDEYTLYEPPDHSVPSITLLSVPNHPGVAPPRMGTTEEASPAKKPFETTRAVEQNVSPRLLHRSSGHVDLRAMAMEYQSWMRRTPSPIDSVAQTHRPSSPSPRAKRRYSRNP